MDDETGALILLVLLIFTLMYSCHGARDTEQMRTDIDDIKATQQEIIELLEAEPETVVLPPMSGPEDERQNVISEGFQEDAR